MKEYKNLNDLKKDIRKGILFNIIKIKQLFFTQDFYDMEGELITYANKTKRKGFKIVTEDRYKKGFQDAILSWVESPLIRNDISYFDEGEKMKKEHKFKIEREYLANSKEDAKEQFIQDIANNNFDIEEVEEEIKEVLNGEELRK